MFLKPRWLLSHLFAISVVVAFIAAGLWQVERLSQRQEENILVESRMAAPVLLDDVLGDDPGQLEFRRIQVTGTYDPANEILIANRSDEGAPGFWLWTSFDTAHGDLLVNRGFVNRGVILEADDALPRSDAFPETGELIIEGLLREGLDGARVSEDGTQITRPDAALAAELLGLSTALDPSVYLELDAQEPLRVSDIPSPVPEPDLGEGPHLSYAFQWFTFATIGVIGYALVLIRIQRGDQSRGDVPV